MSSPRIEVAVVRDPDGGTDIQVFINGAGVSFEEFTVDAGAGFDQESWDAHVEWINSNASEAVCEYLAPILADPPGREYIID